MPTTGTTTATVRATTTPEDGDDLRVRYHRVRGFTEELAEPLSAGGDYLVTLARPAVTA